jgi:hypothetical protein
MSKSASGLARIDYFYRDPGFFKPNTPALLGRWQSRINITGDVSGGSLIFTHTLPSDLGQFVFWNITFINDYSSDVMALKYTRALIVPNERGYPGMYGEQYTFQNNTQFQYWQDAHKKHEFLYRASPDPGSPSIIQVEISPNTNTVIGVSTCGGYLYDERLL